MVAIVCILLWLRYTHSTTEFFDLLRTSDSDFQKQLKRVERKNVRSAQASMNSSLDKQERDFQQSTLLERKKNASLAEYQFSLMGPMIRDMKSQSIHWAPLDHAPNHEYEGSTDTTQEEPPLHGSDLVHSYQSLGPKESFEKYNKLRGFPSSLPGKKFDTM